MKGMLGCLFILLFAGIFAAVGIIRALFNFIFPNYGGTPRDNARRQTRRAYSSTDTDGGGGAMGGGTRAGNARHETKGNAPASNGKIFSKDEGTYVDFEEIQ